MPVNFDSREREREDYKEKVEGRKRQRGRVKGKTKGVGDERATAAALLFSGTRGWLRWLKIFARPDSSRVEYSLLLPPFPLCRFLFDMEKKKKEEI